jgi:hypothetical protein
MLKMRGGLCFASSVSHGTPSHLHTDTLQSATQDVRMHAQHSRRWPSRHRLSCLPNPPKFGRVSVKSVGPTDLTLLTLTRPNFFFQKKLPVTLSRPKIFKKQIVRDAHAQLCVTVTQGERVSAGAHKLGRVTARGA